MKLFMVMIGCRPKGRHTEQHDVFFGIALTVRDIVPALIRFWPEAKGNMHVDAWREITQVDDFKIEVVLKAETENRHNNHNLFFVNLGGYKKGEFEEFHYKMITVAPSKNEAISRAKKTAFYKHTGFKGAPTHVDDKFGIDVDDVFEIKEILSDEQKDKYGLMITPDVALWQDELHLGYFRLNKL